MNMMDQRVTKQIIDLQKATFDNAFSAMAMLQDQAETVLVSKGDLFKDGWPILLQNFLAHEHANMTCRDGQLHNIF